MHQNGRLGATLWDVLVLELLGRCQTIGFVVEPLRFAGELGSTAGKHGPYTAAGNISKPDMEPIESPSVYEEHAIWQIRPLIILQQLWIEAE